jgi:3-hydroxyacyl-[acyl-carrier-protein] dehydratase
MNNYLLDSAFYRILNTEVVPGDSSAIIQIELNKDHRIYKAHFPDFPVTPGVCICQVAQELIQIVLNKKIRLTIGKNIKFLEIINPEKTGTIILDFQISFLENRCLAAQVVVKNTESIFSKLSLIFAIVDE